MAKLSARDQIRQVLSHPREKPLRSLGRSLLAGITIAGLIGALQHFTGIFPSATAASYLLAGICLSLLLWGSDRLWFSMVAPMFAEPFSLWAYLSRLPFWYLSGGIAFVGAVLTARALDWLTIYDLPVKRLFDDGAWIGVVAGIVQQGILYRYLLQTVRQPHFPGSHQHP